MSYLKTISCGLQQFEEKGGKCHIFKRCVKAEKEEENHEQRTATVQQRFEKSYLIGIEWYLLEMLYHDKKLIFCFSLPSITLIWYTERANFSSK